MGSLSSLRSHSSHTRPSWSGHAGKRHRTLNGSAQVETSTYREWRIRIVFKETGITVKQKYYTAQLEGPCAPFRHTIDRMPSLHRVLSAARDYIDRWHENEGARWNEQREKRQREQEFMSSVPGHQGKTIS